MAPAAPTPENEARRLERLRGYRILDTPPSEAFDRVARLASRILRMPIALVSLLDAERQWFKAKVGLDANETPRDVAFCAHTICDTQVMIVPDAMADGRFADNPLVTGDPSIRFYAGAPLRTTDGLNMGTLCVIDRAPREFSDEDKALLEDLARIVIDEMELLRLAEAERLAQTRLVDAVDALPDGFVLYDRDDRLVLCNERYREIYADSADLLVAGAAFEDVIRVGVARGQYPDAIGREADWIRERLDHHRNPSDPIEQRLLNGRWLRIEERKTRDGGLVGFRIDITELKRRAFELERLASTDHLTGALNRRRFLELAEAEVRRAQRYQRSVAVCLLDVDQFKSVNDTHGHAVGDLVLQALIERSHEMMREQDMICRYGGEEFAILLPETGLAGARQAMERLRQALADLKIPTGKAEIGTTVSVGVAISQSADESLDTMLARADKALYQAKITGRNRVVVASEVSELGTGPQAVA